MSAKEIASFLGGNLVFARGEIFMEGDAARWFYLVRSGHVKIVRHSKTGKDSALAEGEAD
jgi:CRP-like cAMP-binding protein